MLKTTPKLRSHHVSDTLWRSLQTFNISRVLIAIILITYLGIKSNRESWLLDHAVLKSLTFIYFLLALGFVYIKLRWTSRFAALLHETVAAQVRSGHLELRRAGLDAAGLAELLLRAAYGLKSPDPVPLSAAEFRARLHQLIGLLCASLIPQRSHAPRTRRSR